MKIFKTPYGVDAPNVVRNLFLFSLGTGTCTALSFLIKSPVWFWVSLLYFGSTFLSLWTAACWMLWSSLFLKQKLAKKLIDELEPKGNEIVLDIGCGRGLLLVEVAKRLPHGKVHGIDLWINKDQSGNSLDATMANAKTAGVDERVGLHTGDMCHLPFPDEYFDAVTSSLAIHNIPTEAGRNQALFEILRVLKPGGKLALLDIQHGKQYSAFINQTNRAQVSCSSPIYRYCPPLRIIQGEKTSPSFDNLSVLP